MFQELWGSQLLPLAIVRYFQSPELAQLRFLRCSDRTRQLAARQASGGPRDHTMEVLCCSCIAYVFAVCMHACLLLCLTREMRVYILACLTMWRIVKTSGV